MVCAKKHKEPDLLIAGPAATGLETPVAETRQMVRIVLITVHKIWINMSRLEIRRNSRNKLDSSSEESLPEYLSCNEDSGGPFKEDWSFWKVNSSNYRKRTKDTKKG